jgi:hypothetical protein
MCVVGVKCPPPFVAEMVSPAMRHIVDAGLLE